MLSSVFEVMVVPSDASSVCRMAPESGATLIVVVTSPTWSFRSILAIWSISSVKGRSAVILKPAFFAETT